MRHRAVVVALIVTVVLGSAGDSHAFMRWFDKLSGPGPFAGIELKLRTDKHFRPLEIAFGTAVPVLAPEADETAPRFTLGLSFGWAFSYKNRLDYGGGPGVGSPTVQLLSLEASAEYWPVKPFVTTDQWNFFVSGGVSADYFSGAGFEDFLQSAVVLRMGPRYNQRWLCFHAIEFGFEGHFFLDEWYPQTFGALPGPRLDRFVPGIFLHLYFWEFTP